jgi:SAM-dependent methyltransferase
MSDVHAVAAVRDQDNVWDYYQSDGLAIFDDAVPRLGWLYRQARRLVPAGQPRTLNIGIGNGWLERRCHAAGWASWGLDPNPRSVEALRAQGVQAVVGGIEAMPFDDASYDIVFSSEVFEHLLDDLLDRGLGEIHRVLAPGGYLVGTVPCNERLDLKSVVCPACSHVHHAFGHHQSFGRPRLEALFRKAGLEPRYFSTRSFPPFASRAFKGKLKSLVWYLLGRFGAQAADAKIAFVVQRPAAGRAKPVLAAT